MKHGRPAIKPWFGKSHFPEKLWTELSHDKLSAATGFTVECLDRFFEEGALELHEVLLDRRVGVMVLYQQPREAGGALVVFWIEMAPRPWDHDWLIDAADYLREIARHRGCPSIQACVDVNRRDRWQERLEGVGFKPSLLQLELDPMEEAKWQSPQ